MPNFNLNFSMQFQLQTNWCWAATSASIDAFYNPLTTVSQCGLANTVHGQTTCCADGSTPGCNQPAVTGDVLSMLGRLRNQTDQAEPFDVVDQEIATNRRPLGARIVWSGGGAHAVVISGVGDAANPLLTIRDSWYGTNYVLYPVFASAYQGTGRWVRSWFTK
jgi:hypothetical protein